MAKIKNGLLGPLLSKLTFGRPLSLRNSFFSARNWSFPLDKLNGEEFDWLASFVHKKISIDSLSEVVLGHYKGSHNNNQFVSFKPFFEKKSPHLLKDIAKLLESSEAIIGFGAYGSVADDTWRRGSSDLDLAVVLDLDEIESQENFIQLFETLVQANRQVLSLDPLQHHGITIIIARDIWPENLVPIEILKEIRWYSIKYSIFKFQITKDKFSCSTALKSSIKLHIHKLLNYPLSFFNLYLAKVIFSSILMLLIFLQEEKFQEKKSKKEHLKTIYKSAPSKESLILKYATEFRDTLNYSLTRVAASKLINCNIVRLQLYIIIESFLVGDWNHKYNFEFKTKKRLEKLLDEI